MSCHVCLGDPGSPVGFCATRPTANKSNMSNLPDQVDKARIVFMGTPDFAVPSLDALVAEGLRPVAVVTGPDKPRGRGRRLSPTPVKVAALGHGIDTILEPDDVRDPSFAKAVHDLAPDIIVVVAFRILPPAVFKAARLGAFNLHGSLLPAYRGAAPINRAIMAGETRTGVTTFFLQEKVDTGSIILSRTMDIGPEETAGEVHDRMMVLGAEAVVETVRRILRGEAEAQPQDDSLASPAPKIFKEDCRIDWNLADIQVHNMIRGLSPHPGAWTTYRGRPWKVFRSRVAAASRTGVEKGVDGETGVEDPPVVSDQPGRILVEGATLWAGCAAGAIQILELQQEGRRRISAEDFLHGQTFDIGDRFE